VYWAPGILVLQFLRIQRVYNITKGYAAASYVMIAYRLSIAPCTPKYRMTVNIFVKCIISYPACKVIIHFKVFADRTNMA